MNYLQEVNLLNMDIFANQVQTSAHTACWRCIFDPGGGWAARTSCLRARQGGTPHSQYWNQQQGGGQGQGQGQGSGKRRKKNTRHPRLHEHDTMMNVFKVVNYDVWDVHIKDVIIFHRAKSTFCQCFSLWVVWQWIKPLLLLSVNDITVKMEFDTD